MGKQFFDGNKIVNVELRKEKFFWVVTVDGVVYKETANELFAVQAFNEI